MRNNDTGMSGHGEPMLTAAQAAHAQRVRAHIAGRIAAAGGWMSFENYMDLALYAPGLGYYSAGARKFGEGGDFTTAPELSALFGACVARQCAEVLDALGGGDLLEIGAGTGRLAVDVLSRLERSDRLPGRYLILEPSADLRERQQRLLDAQLPHLGARVAWLDAPPLQAFRGAILANEVLDALPSHASASGVITSRNSAWHSWTGNFRGHRVGPAPHSPPPAAGCPATAHGPRAMSPNTVRVCRLSRMR